MLCRLAILLQIAAQVFLVQGALAQGLSARECAEIQSIYNIVPPQCSTAAAAPAIAPTTPVGTMRESHVFFPQGGTQLDSAALAQIAMLGQILEGQVLGQACLQLIGHSDSSGGTEANRSLALRRAEAVRDALGRKLRVPSRIESVLSLGESHPLETMPASSVWQRRVEIRARNCPGA
jgi:outer membrane protein OmpA-like peptidoglycan-associated protein